MIPYTHWHLKKNISAAGIKMLDSNNNNSERIGQALFTRGSALTILSSLVPKPFGMRLHRIMPQATILIKLSEVSRPVYTSGEAFGH